MLGNKLSKGVEKYKSEYVMPNKVSWEETKFNYTQELWYNSKLFGLMFPSHLSNEKEDQMLRLVSQIFKEGIVFMDDEPNEAVKDLQSFLIT